MRCAACLALLLFIFLVACDTSPVRESLESSRWKLASITLGEEETVEIPDTLGLLLEFKEGKVSGRGGCNDFFASYSTDEGSIAFTGLGATRMYCPEVMNLETRFFNALKAAESYAVRRDELLIYAGVQTLHFRRLTQVEEASVTREQKRTQFDHLFASDLTQGPLHVYAVEYPNEVENYPFEGTEIPHEYYEFFGPQLAANWEELGWGVYAIGKYHDDYLVRIPGRYTSDQIALYDLSEGRMHYLATVAAKWCDSGWCNQQDGWLVDLNKDDRYDLLTRFVQLDEQDEMMQEEWEAKLQDKEGGLLKTTDVAFDKEDFLRYK